ncbi:glycoside hydrolase family protein [Algoriphagus resistens]|uniref:glycoside hydrolase family 88 protein n=1 Tax=Algoriphagus resistens TaxID=1750590 RepID=UPI00071687B3|nr:glycoside hydrolase family 88 protein [Algoriphagus resistens]
MKYLIPALPNFFITLVCVCLAGSCTHFTNKEADSCTELDEFIQAQYGEMVTWGHRNGALPRSVENGAIKPVAEDYDWTAGFFPGSLWYLYELSGDRRWKSEARFFQDKIKDMRFFSGHDLGFIFNCSYGHGYRIEPSDADLRILQEAGNTLVARFNPTVGAIKSWDTDRGWKAARGWIFPVNIAGMMNLELLFRLTEWTDDPSYRELAVRHAKTTLAHFFRNDYSSYQIVDFDTLSGNALQRQTAQGYSDESSWARGQAWGLYGFTVAYEFTGDPEFLRQAERIADFYLRHTNLPPDKVPAWDLSLAVVASTPRDVSTSSIVAAALLRLDPLSEQNYKNPAEEILASLGSSDFRAGLGENHHFLLKNSTGSIPHSKEVNVPLNYADYYFLEALYRLKRPDRSKEF